MNQELKTGLKWFIAVVALFYVLYIYFGTKTLVSAGLDTIALYALLLASCLRITFLSYQLDKDGAKWTEFDNPIVVSARKWVVYILVCVGGLIFKSGQTGFYHIGFVCALIFFGYRTVPVVRSFREAKTTPVKALCLLGLLFMAAVMIAIIYLWIKMGSKL